EFAYKVHALDLTQLDGNHVTGGVQQFDLALRDEGGADVAVHCIAVHLADDHFLVGRCHSRPAHPASPIVALLHRICPNGCDSVAKLSTLCYCSLSGKCDY